MPRRTPVRLASVLVVAAVALTAIVSGLIRAALYEPPAVDAVAAAGGGTYGRCGGVPTRATRELRGMWLTTVNNGDFPSRPGLPPDAVKAEYLTWVDLAVSQNYNAIFVHVRPSGDAFWQSRYAPWSYWLTGRQDGVGPGWDPMAFMVAEAHRRNLEFHAWFNPYKGDQSGPSGPGTDFTRLPANHPLQVHRDWAIPFPKGTYGQLYFDPGNPDARRFLEDSILEPLRVYDIDGVHFDDFFYPYPVKGQDFPDAASYAKRTQPGQSLADWRRANVDLFVQELSVRIKQVKPWVKFGISPFGIWRNRSNDPAGSDTHGLQAYDAIYADTRKWVREGWLDYIAPQLYWPIGYATADYATLVPWWSALVKGTGVQLYIGMADYRVGEAGAWKDPAQLDMQLTLNARYAVSGVIHFSARHVRADKLGSVSRYRNAHDADPALPPPPRVAAPPPGAPRLVSPRSVGNGRVTFDWENGLGPAPVSWALYRVEGPAARLVAAGRVGAALPAVGAGTYCLSALDRLGDEGPPSAPITA